MTTTISKTYGYREWQTVTLLGLIALSIISYMFFINQVVFHARDRQNTNREIAILQGEVTNLETRVLALGNNVTMDLAYERGFLDSGTQTSSYATTKETTPLLVSWRGYGRE